MLFPSTHINQACLHAIHSHGFCAHRGYCLLGQGCFSSIICSNSIDFSCRPSKFERGSMPHGPSCTSAWKLHCLFMASICKALPVNGSLVACQSQPGRSCSSVFPAVIIPAEAPDKHIQEDGSSCCPYLLLQKLCDKSICHSFMATHCRFACKLGQKPMFEHCMQPKKPDTRHASATSDKPCKCNYYQGLKHGCHT